MMRAKMKIDSVIRHENVEQVDLEMSAVHRDEYDEKGSDENNTYARFTPCADLSMAIQNPSLLDKFHVGQTFYVDFTAAE